MKMWDERDNAVEELEKLKIANKNNKVVFIIQDDDEQEPNCKRFRRNVIKASLKKERN